MVLCWSATWIIAITQLAAQRPPGHSQDKLTCKDWQKGEDKSLQGVMNAIKTAEHGGILKTAKMMFLSGQTRKCELTEMEMVQEVPNNNLG